MKKYIVVKESSKSSFELMLDGLSEQGYELEPATACFNECIGYFAIMSKEIE